MHLRFQPWIATSLPEMLLFISECCLHPGYWASKVFCSKSSLLQRWSPASSVDFRSRLSPTSSPSPLRAAVASCRRRRRRRRRLRAAAAAALPTVFLSSSQTSTPSSTGKHFSGLARTEHLTPSARIERCRDTLAAASVFRFTRPLPYITAFCDDWLYRHLSFNAVGTSLMMAPLRAETGPMLKNRLH